MSQPAIIGFSDSLVNANAIRKQKHAKLKSFSITLISSFLNTEYSLISLVQVAAICQRGFQRKLAVHVMSGLGPEALPVHTVTDR